MIAAPPAAKFATICAVTSCGYALTPSAATPWSAAATTIAASAARRRAPPPSRRSARQLLEPAEAAARLRLRVERGCAARARRFVRGLDRREQLGGAQASSPGAERAAGDDEERLVRRLGPDRVDAAEHVAVRAPERRRRDASRGPAMSREQAVRGLVPGAALAAELAADGAGAIGLGDMGIGNTTAASALCACLLPADPAAVCGRGTGLDDAGLARKVEVVDAARSR